MAEILDCRVGYFDRADNAGAYVNAIASRAVDKHAIDLDPTENAGEPAAARTGLHVDAVVERMPRLASPIGRASVVIDNRYIPDEYVED